MSERAEILEDWLTHPGTQAFFEHVEREWGAGGRRFEASVSTYADSREEDASVLRKIQQIVVCRREILRLKSWGSEELARLKAGEGESSSVRPPLAPELAGQSRRGGL